MKNKLMLLFVLACIFCITACSYEDYDDVVVLRVCNWEEYIDEGGWDDDELIELDNGERIIGEDPVYKEFEDWYYSLYGKKVRVEYSTFGTNEELYNQLTIGDRFDIVCPSEYMIMKLMAENQLVPYSDDFYDESIDENYYIRGVSPYIRSIFERKKINGQSWGSYAAGYMWGTTGVVYNPEEVSREEASAWSILADEKFRKRVTIKDNVRDAYFAALGMYKREKLIKEEFKAREDYVDALELEMNDTSDETLYNVENILRQMKENAFSFETDSGKADMVSGKVLANYQWSGDAVYTIEQAEEDDIELCYEVPKECGNLWFDGWVMLKSGLEEDQRKQHAAQAFVNYLSKPDIAVRNMYYIGYTSVLSGPAGDTTIFDYVNWYYATDEEEDTIDYDISYFFGRDENDEYLVHADAYQEYGALAAQYPSLDIIRRCSIMDYFDNETYEKINQMWINVRCFNPFR